MNLTARNLLVSFCLVLISQIVFSQPSNNNSSSATIITPSTSCNTIAGDLYQATSDGIASSCGTTNDVWYQVTLPANAISTTITVAMPNGNLATSSNTYMEVFNASTYGAISTSNSNGCISVSSSLTLSLAGSTTYYFRIFTTTSTNPPNGNPSGKFGFTVCVSYTTPPSNDDCSGAVSLTSGVTNSSGTVWNATASSGIATGCSTGTPDDDVWYKITTSTFSNSLSVTLPSVGSDLNTSGPRIQVFSGSCGSLTSLACGTTSVTTSVSGNTTYYIRVYSAGAGAIGSTSTNSVFSITATVSGPTVVTSSRMNEVFQETILSDNNALNYPWEVAYGPDSMLWITESRGYKVYRMNPNTGVKTTVLDLNTGSTWLPSPADSLDAVGLTSTSNWNSTVGKWPQGGLAGLALHPNFLDGTGLNDYVYVSYVHRYLSGTTSSSTGIYFRNKLVRFTYNTSTGKLESPVVLCDTLPGGSDHNSQRIIIAPVTKGGTYYLFYAQGDLGAGQFENRLRPENAQYPTSYEGKILRFNLVSDNDAGADAWIPNDNPYNTLLGKQSAVYSIGIRNNQGFAYDSLSNVLYGSSHGPYSDDEINVIEPFRNYGHPLIEGFVDGNYDGNSAQGTSTSVSAGAPYTDNLGVSTCAPIGSESANKAAINASGNGLYKDPLFSAYAATKATVTTIWQTNPGNANPAPGWPTEAWSGLDLYSNTLIPGWKRSLVAASLKWGRLVRLKLDAAGTATYPTNSASDTVTYFNSQNRFRDLAFSPNGKDIFVIMDNTSTTSGPGSANPVVPTCAGCVHKYTFLGYLADANGESTISTTVDVAAGTANACQTGTTITIDSTNYNLWVPITGQDGNILAEIKANGNKLGTVTSSFYTNTGAVRENAQKKLYSDRNITITPQNQPSSSVDIRIYMTAAEFNSLKTATNSQGNSSGVNAISDVAILKNSDVCSSAMSNSTTTITPQYAKSFGSNYVLQGTITSFSTFYLANANTVTLPVRLISFAGSLENNSIANLQWETTNEVNTSHFVVERSSDGTTFIAIGSVTASGVVKEKNAYSFADKDAGLQQTENVYYRLKMIDNDGQFSYSKVINLALNRNMNVFLFPNPVRQMLNVQLKSRELNAVTIQISDLNGRTVYYERRNVQQTNFTIDVKEWKPQLYVVKILTSKNEVLSTQKFEKL